MSSQLEFIIGALVSAGWVHSKGRGQGDVLTSSAAVDSPPEGRTIVIERLDDSRYRVTLHEPLGYVHYLRDFYTKGYEP